ncbi:cipC protein [Obba rivulosa]|uniref:CipC protein n=1 Tax=Obba rivulosa TaxID=1052685 RepID=A0A8E2DQY5_9APHY|nr:cipC protein [Obba rivulosa]
MGWFSDDSYQAQAYDQVTNAPHKAELSHELIAAAASYEAAKAYERHCEANGKPASHAEAKELLAGVAGAFVDRFVETKGLDWVDKEKAKRDAHQQFEEAVIQPEYY